MELHFFENCYIGVSAIENRGTNICGLAPERTLRSFGFRPDDLLESCASLPERLSPLTRTMEWLVTGPLAFSKRFRPSESSDPALYPAGDALGFIDPFTGSGILNAMLTGELAGLAAAQGVSSEEYLRNCSRLLRRPFLISGAFRAILAPGRAGRVALLVPGRILFYATRPVA